MQISNSQGRRFEVIARAPQGTFAVPPPYTVEGFLSTLPAPQRRTLYVALSTRGALPGLDPSRSPRPPTDAVVLGALTRLTRGRYLCFVPAFDRSSGTTARTPRPAAALPEPSRPAPAASAPAPRQEVVCELLTTSAECGHNGRKANRSGLLEVVPGRGGDRIRLQAELRGSCGQHARWDIQSPGANEVKKGTAAAFVVKSWGVKTLWGVFEVLPRSYYVTGTACSGAAQRFEIKAYPIDQWKVSVDVDFKKNPLQWTWEVSLTNWEDLGGEDEGLKVKSQLREALANKKQQLEYAFDKVLSPLVGPTTKWEFFKTKLYFNGKWAEHTDHRAFYKYEATLKLDPLVKGEFQIPFGPTAAIPPWIKRWATDYIGDFYLYLKFSGELSLMGRWGRSDPDHHQATVSGEGKLGVKVGGNLFLMKRGALNLDVNGGTFVSVEAKAPVARKPAVEYDLKWGGIEVEITVEAAWGMVEYKRKWRPVEGGSFFTQPKLWHPLGQ